MSGWDLAEDLWQRRSACFHSFFLYKTDETMTQEDDTYAGEGADFSVTVLNVGHTPHRNRGSASAPTRMDRQPSSHHQKQHSHSKSSPNTSSPRRRPNAPTIASLPKLGDLSLNSVETSQIVGTPFATDSKPFEYPFPDNPPDMQHSDFSSRSVSTTSSVHTSPALMTTQWGSTYLSPSTSPTMIPGHRHASMGEYTPPLSTSSGSTSSSIASSTSSFAATPMTHSKLIAPVYGPPPIPPSLIKKRPKWTLGIIGRRKSGVEDDDDEQDDGQDFLVSPNDMGRREY